MIARIKLPKQWKHWCKIANLRPHTNNVSRTGRSSHGYFYLKGRGHHWRVNCFGDLQRGDSYADFDKWARCDITELPMPLTQAKFMETIHRLETDTTLNPWSKNYIAL
jgi:hypothetical protein